MSCRQPKPCDCTRCIRHRTKREAKLKKIRAEIQERKNLIRDAKNVTIDAEKEYIFNLLKKIVSEL